MHTSKRFRLKISVDKMIIRLVCVYACAHSSAPFTFLDVLDVTFFSFVHDVLLDPNFGSKSLLAQEKTL